MWRRFKFEAWWALEESCEVIICRVWDSESGDVLTKFDVLKGALQKWEKDIKKKQGVEVKNLNDRLDLLTEAERDDATLA